MRTNLNNRVLGPSDASIFLSNDHSLYSPITLDECHDDFICMDQSICQERVESDKIQNENFLPTVGREPTTLRFLAWCSTDWALLTCQAKHRYVTTLNTVLRRAWIPLLCGGVRSYGKKEHYYLQCFANITNTLEDAQLYIVVWCTANVLHEMSARKMSRNLWERIDNIE